MSDKDGFKYVVNSGCPKETLNRGYSRPMSEEDRGYGIFGVGYGDYVGDTQDIPLFEGGFCGRPMGWER